MMTTGERIQAARKKAGLTQAELAEKLGISPVGVSQWERNTRNPKYETLQKIAEALSVNVDSLFTDREREISDIYDVNGWFRAIDFFHVDESKQYIDKVKAAFDTIHRIGYSFSEAEAATVQAFSKLNPSGQSKAVERVEELTEIPKYQKTPPPDGSDGGKG